ncbi:MAG: hypothetical protein KKG47_08355 [Proteobacteria bacterium]|nr:hypothetical protein [Pseudomonadota bacterium]MBU1739347.1 hypothetical protein [Pseudomonadota bacterium]
MFRDECDHCGRDLHICLNCAFYDPNVSRECREPAIPDAVHDKERKNLCEYFKMKGGENDAAYESESEAARRKLEELFK